MKGWNVERLEGWMVGRLVGWKVEFMSVCRSQK